MAYVIHRLHFAQLKTNVAVLLIVCVVHSVHRMGEKRERREIVGEKWKMMIRSGIGCEMVGEGGREWERVWGREKRGKEVGENGRDVGDGGGEVGEDGREVGENVRERWWREVGEGCREVRESRAEVGEAGEMCESMERNGRGWEMVGRMGEK